MSRIANLFFVCVVAAGATVALPAKAGDLEELQGAWEMNVTSGGVPHRVVKTIAGRTETVEVFKGDTLVQKHTVNFELKSYGPAKVFHWRDGKISAGPRAGTDLADGRFIYRLEKDTWTAVHGMLDGDKTGVVREVYKRTDEPDPPPAT